MYRTIVNPETGRKVKVNGKIGQKVLNNYKKQYGGALQGENCETHADCDAGLYCKNMAFGPSISKCAIPMEGDSIPMGEIEAQKQRTREAELNRKEQIDPMASAPILRPSSDPTNFAERQDAWRRQQQAARQRGTEWEKKQEMKETEREAKKLEIKEKLQKDSKIGTDCNEHSKLYEHLCCNPVTRKVIEIPLADESGERYGQLDKNTLRLPLRDQVNSMCKTKEELEREYQRKKVLRGDKLKGMLRRKDPRNILGRWTTGHFKEGKFVGTQREEKLALDAFLEGPKLYQSVHGSGGGKKKSPKRKSKRNNSNKNRNNKKNN